MFIVRIHHRRMKTEYKVNYLTATVPAEKWDHRSGQNKTVMVGLPDNGTLVSIGLDVGLGQYDVTVAQLAHLIKTGQAVLVPPAEMGHGGCQSRCVLRGDKKCQW